MKAAWFLASNTGLKTSDIIKSYSKRWKIEPFFRDLKDGRFGMGLEQTHIKSCERRDRLMLVDFIKKQNLFCSGGAVIYYACIYKTMENA